VAFRQLTDDREFGVAPLGIQLKGKVHIRRESFSKFSCL